MIKIFNENDRDFSSNGNIAIKPIKCREIHKKSLNGWYIEVELPVEYKDYVTQDKLCVIKSKAKINPQAFRINSPKISNKIIRFTAEHVMFDSRKYFLTDVRPTNETAQNALSNINSRTDKKSPFTVFSNVNTQNTAYFIRKSLFEAWATIEERWGGSFDADNWNINLLNKVGYDNGESINYTKNMQGIEIIEDWSEVCTKIYPVGSDELMLPEEFLESEIQYTTPYTRTVTFNSDLEFDESVSEEERQKQLIEELRTKAKKYLEENQYPRVSYEVTSNINQNMGIGDTIHVKTPLVNLLTEVLEYECNNLTDKIEVLRFGNYSRDVKNKFDNIKDGLNNVAEELLKGFSKRDIVIKHQTELINSLNKKGLVYIDDNEILILDKLPKEKAKNVWRFGLGGLGFSSNGYEGPFETAITMDGQINANFITAGTLDVARISGLQDTLKGFSTSIELNEDNVKIAVDKANDVEKRLNAELKIIIDEKNLISKINASADVIALAAGRFTLTSGNCTLDKEGHMILKNGLEIHQISENGTGLELVGEPPYIDFHKDNYSTSDYWGRLIYDTDNSFRFYNKPGYHYYFCDSKDPVGYIHAGQIDLRGPVTGASNLITTDSMKRIDFKANGDGYLEVENKDGGVYGITIWASDEKLKKDIKDTEINALDVINKIQHRQFNWKSDNRHEDNGYIANELQKIVSGFVFEVGEGENATLQINANKIIPYITKAIQEEFEKLSSLEERIKNIEKSLI